jgi:nitroimidazol reductase NimA-like FMN-containing flavoprotein (pyridoxamine 5'-phosphate oxidase superfamily)
MRLIDPWTGIEMLDREECLRRLAGDVIGRLAVVHANQPEIVPVNYVLDGENIVFRTASGTKLAAAGRSPASFEIDDFDRDDHTGWSVVAIGRLEELLPGQAAYQQVKLLPVEPWAPGVKEHWMRLVPTRITGRIIRSVDG